MKKILSLILCLVMCVSVSALLVSCEDHECEFEKKLSSNEDYHWYACKSDDCKEKSKKEKHDFEESVTDGAKKLVCKECGYEKEITAPEHDCEFDVSKWTSNEDFHWYACKQEGCIERSEEAEHDFDVEIEHEANLIRKNYTCRICDYSYSDQTEIESVIDGEASWESAFDNLEYKNFSLEVYFETVGSHTETNYCYVSENAAYYSIHDGLQFYTVKNADGSFTTYSRAGVFSDPYSGFTKLDDTSDEYYRGASTESVVRVSFADYFEKFKFNESSGVYYCDETIACTISDFDGNYSESIYCYDTEIRVADGKIVNIYSKYYFDEIDTSKIYSFKYENIGMTVVSVPQKVISSATNETN